MANVTLETKIVVRNDNSSRWLELDPVLLKGEIGVEIDNNKFKFGNGTNKWSELEYASSQPAVLLPRYPIESDVDYDVGTTWIDTLNKNAFILYSITDGKANWKQLVTENDIAELRQEAMFKSIYATNEKSSSGYVDSAIKADKLTTPRTITVTGDLSGVPTAFDGSKDIAITARLQETGVTSGEYTKVKVDSKGRVIQGTKATNADIEYGMIPYRAIISDTKGNLVSSSTTSTELSYLSGVTGGIQSQIDNIPKYNYLNGLSIEVPDGSTQQFINQKATETIIASVASPRIWDAVVVRIVFTPSDNIKDALYCYNQTKSWVFLYYVSTGINRANGTFAGIVESSDDINFIDGLGTVLQSDKVKHTLTIGDKVFDGSEEIIVTSQDIGEILDVPIATDSKVGGVISSNLINEVSVNSTTGKMSLNQVSVSKLSLNGDVLILNGGTA